MGTKELHCNNPYYMQPYLTPGASLRSLAYCRRCTAMYLPRHAEPLPSFRLHQTSTHHPVQYENEHETMFMNPKLRALQFLLQ